MPCRGRFRVPSVAGQEGEGAEETSRSAMKITVFWSASVSNSIHYVLGSVCGPDGLGLLKGAAGAVCAVVIKIKEEAMKNEEVLDLIARNKKFYSVFFRAILLVYLLILAFAFLRMLSAFSSRGLGIEVVAVLYVLFLVTIWYLIVCFIVLVFGGLVVNRRFRARKIEALRNQLKYIIRPDFEHVWTSYVGILNVPNPGIFCIECQRQFVLISSLSTGYEALRLDAGNVVSMKIERRSFVETEARGSMRGSSGFYSTRSSSISVTKETAVLEITYKGSDNLPYVAVIPFDEDRISAERAQYMIQMFS